MNNDYIVLYRAFDFFNEKLFNNVLNPVIISTQRKRNANGYFWANIITNRYDGTVAKHEIALNIDNFDRGEEYIWSTLVHEMCHEERYDSSVLETPKGKYHDKHWAAMMIEVGLKPFNIKDESKMIGLYCSHHIVADGPFELACKEFMSNPENHIEWKSIANSRKSTQSKKSKIVTMCCGCDGSSIETRSTYKVTCGVCGQRFKKN